MITISDTTTVNEKLSKGWIFSNGTEMLFPYNQEHYTFIPDAECGNYEPELKRGGVRLLTMFTDKQIAFNIFEINSDAIYKIIAFMRRHLIFEEMTIIIESISMEHIEFYSFRDLCNFYNLQLVK